jgi:hypothetical protein
MEMKENGKEFFRSMCCEGFPNIKTSGLRMTSIFGSTHLYKSAFSNMSFIKYRHRIPLVDDCLLFLLKLAATQIQVDIQSLVADRERPECSH